MEHEPSGDDVSYWSGAEAVRLVLEVAGYFTGVCVVCVKLHGT